MSLFRKYSVLFICLLFLGCDEGVEAVRTDGKAYTMYGYLNPRSETQALPDKE